MRGLGGQRRAKFCRKSPVGLRSRPQQACPATLSCGGSTPVASPSISCIINSLKATKISVQCSYNRCLREADSQGAPVQCGLFPRYSRDTPDEYLVAFLRTRREPEWNVAILTMNQAQRNEALLPGLHMSTGCPCRSHAISADTTRIAVLHDGGGHVHRSSAREGFR